MTSPRVIILGAGWQGIAAAKSYLRINPLIKLTILDAEQSFGGIWSKSRIYPGLVVDSPRSMIEYPEISMVDSSHPAFGHVPGAEVSEYLTKVAQQAGLERLAKFNTIVRSIRRNKSDGWLVETDKETLKCDKLIMATGLYYVPNIPDVPRSRFQGPMFHNKSLARDHALLTAPEVKDVVVVGGAKSSFEVVDLCLKANKRVHWIIRETGNGPAMIVKKNHGRFDKLLFNFARSRFFGSLNPSIFSPSGFGYRFLHSGSFGPGFRFIQRLLSSSPNTFDYSVSENAKKLVPEVNNMFWSTTSYAFLSEDSTVLKAIKADDPNLHVYRGDLADFEEHTLRLIDGTIIPADAVAFATGWKHAQSSLFSPDDQLDLGLPTALEHEPDDMRLHWEKLDAQADNQVLSLFPILRSPPAHKAHPPHSTQQRQFRGMISPSQIARNDRSIAFLGNTIVAHTPIHSHIGSIWAIAWLENLMSFPSTQPELEKQVALCNAWVNRRYIAKGRHQSLIMFESQSFFDALLRDMGLEVRRHKGWMGWCSEWFAPYVAADYKGLEYELLARVRREGIVNEGTIKS